MNLTWPTLESERLLLRRLSSFDAVDVYAYAQHPDVAQFTTWQPHASIEETRAYLEAIQQQYQKAEAAPWGIVLKETSTVIGTVGFSAVSVKDRRAEVAIALAQEQWSLGYATEAVRRVLAYGFQQLRLHRIDATCRLENAAAARVLEKVGMTHEGTLRDCAFIQNKAVSMHVWSMLKPEFMAGTGARGGAMLASVAARARPMAWSGVS